MPSRRFSLSRPVAVESHEVLALAQQQAVEKLLPFTPQLVEVPDVELLLFTRTSSLFARANNRRAVLYPRPEGVVPTLTLPTTGIWLRQAYSHRAVVELRLASSAPDVAAADAYHQRYRDLSGKNVPDQEQDMALGLGSLPLRVLNEGDEVPIIEFTGYAVTTGDVQSSIYTPPANV